MFPRRARRWFSLPLVCAVVWALTEILSLGLHPLVLGRAFSIQNSTNQRRLVLQDASHAVPDTRAARIPDEDTLNPYLGFTGDPDVDAGFSNLGFWGSLAWPPPTREPSTVLVGITGGSFAAELYDVSAAYLRSGLAEIPQFSGRDVVAP